MARESLSTTSRARNNSVWFSKVGFESVLSSSLGSSVDSGQVDCGSRRGSEIGALELVGPHRTGQLRWFSSVFLHS
ncbi:hypothetical protein ACFX2G_015017 [Malus domestica]